MPAEESDLEGVVIPGTNKTLVVSLFADDTTIYLKSTDSMETLWSILHLWCAASTAKFNAHKTVLLPFGKSSYRQKVITERRINNHSPIDDINTTIRIVPDGESCRMLGAWIGNNIPYTTPWPSVLEKMNTDLMCWQATHPTLEGKHHIISMVIGGRTQYLTRVQGMPKDIEDTLERLTRSFLWDGKTARISLEAMILPVDQGGKGILDISSRNKAINLWNLHCYLMQGDDRPLWC
jgi:hypothetical protein